MSREIEILISQIIDFSKAFYKAKKENDIYNINSAQYLLFATLDAYESAIQELKDK